MSVTVKDTINSLVFLLLDNEVKARIEANLHAGKFLDSDFVDYQKAVQQYTDNVLPKINYITANNMEFNCNL
jgi:hypothetical protein